jgi:putative two-component system response regulator
LTQDVAASITSARVLVVDDEETNLRLFRRFLERDGYQNVRTLSLSGDVINVVDDFQPDLILLDLHMPPPDGFDILRALGPRINGPEFLPVLVLTGDGSAESKMSALSLGARDFLAKPFDATEAMLRIRNLLETRLLYRALEDQNAQLETRVQKRTSELQQSQIETLERLARASDIRDDDTGRHTQRVGELSGDLALALGLGPRMSDLVRRAAPLHDVGKIGIPDSILLKPGRLTPEEAAVMRTHTVVGARVLSGGQSEVMMMAERIALSHHERWDGDGYPHGLAGAAIPIEARIVAVADCVDALSHNRPYRPSWPVRDVLEKVRKSAGTHFDPEVVEAMMKSECHHRIVASPPHAWPAVNVAVAASGRFSDRWL